jgi:hypothetical protein
MFKHLNMIIDETLVNFIKRKHPTKGRRRTKRDDPTSSQKCTNPKGVSKGTKEQIMFQSLQKAQEAYRRKKGKGNLKA